MSAKLASYLGHLKAVIEESQKPVTPDVDSKDVPDITQWIEDQDLQRGAILKAPIHPPTKSDSPSPSPNDLVFIHYTISSNSYILSSTRSQDGGPGLPIPLLLGPSPQSPSSSKHTTSNTNTKRYPRGVELALLNMKLGERSAMKIQPNYGFLHPQCTVPPPQGLDTSTPLQIDIQLTHTYPHRSHGNFTCLGQSGILKKVVTKGSGWETPREPFQVSFHLEAYTLSPSLEEDQLPSLVEGDSGYKKRKYFSSKKDENSRKEVIQCQLGMGTLPPGVEEALSSMNKEERCIVLCPADLATTPPTSTTATTSLSPLLPSPPIFIDDTAVAAPAYIIFDLTLDDFTQVRDLIGDGSAVKSIIIKGKGEFPIDCPLEDCQVKIHYRLKKKDNNNHSEEWLFDSRDGSANNNGIVSPPVVVETGAGEVPLAMDLAVRMMLRGEVCLVEATWEKSYKNVPAEADDTAGSGKKMPSGELLKELKEYKGKLLFEVELVDFETETNWHHLPTDGKLDRAEKWKDDGNTLYKSSKYTLAKQKYLKAAKFVGEISREIETEEQGQRCERVNLALFNNLAMCALKMEDFGDALSYCDKALKVDPMHGKAHFRKAMGHAGLGEFEAAAEDLRAAERCDPKIKEDVSRERGRLAAREKAAAVKQKKEFGNFF